MNAQSNTCRLGSGLSAARAPAMIYFHPILEVRHMIRGGLICFFLALGISAQSPGEKEIPKQNPYQSDADLARGKQLFLGHCAPCHGPEGDGGKGANLARPILPRAADDQSLYRVL